MKARPADQPRHAVVLGATGMLRDVVLGLVDRGWEVTAVARNAGRLARLAKERPGKIHPLALDYTDGDALAGSLAEVAEERGDVTLVVAWIHGTAPDAPLLVAQTLATGQTLRYVHVLGSAAADPSIPDAGRRAAFDLIHGVAYQEVILGFVRESGGSRWLRDDEIAAGVLDAVDTHRSHEVVGVVRPWADRP